MHQVNYIPQTKAEAAALPPRLVTKTRRGRRVPIKAFPNRSPIGDFSPSAFPWSFDVAAGDFFS